ncbi:hypothetical protein [Niallia sp. Krafla_26]|uniref:hypothetical protein n=1 Tax=Niallia sp. Krafla_26 TaxID=3064703 RepID=UPI003D186529
MSDRLDRIIENELNKNITITPDDKDEIWANIETELFQKEPERKRPVVRKKKKRWVPLFVTVAATVLLLIGLQTDTGFAVIDKIKTMFAPEKEIPQQLEGNVEDTKVNLQEGTKSNYIIYIDESRYKMEKGENMDVIVPKEPLGESYPEVSMSIQEVLDQGPQELIREYEEKLKETGVDVSEIVEVESPVKGWMVRGLSGHEWDSSITRYYVISNGREGSFLFTQKFFLEAEEGHGARMDAMLKEFAIVE